MVGYHPVRPLAWLVGATTVAFAADYALGLDAMLPVDLAVCFAVLILGWVALLTLRMFASRGISEGRGRVG
jgi:hypothetical protein